MSLTVNMKWKQAAQMIALALENGTPEGKQIAKEELMKMADVADFAVDLQDELKRLSGDTEREPLDTLAEHAADLQTKRMDGN